MRNCDRVIPARARPPALSVAAAAPSTRRRLWEYEGWEEEEEDRDAIDAKIHGGFICVQSSDRTETVPMLCMFCSGVFVLETKVFCFCLLLRLFINGCG